MTRGGLIRLILASVSCVIVAGLIAGAVYGAFTLPKVIYEFGDAEESLMRPATFGDLVEHMVWYLTGGAVVGVFVGLPILVLAGLPAHAWLVGQMRSRWPYYAIAGLLTGLIGVVPVVALNVPRAVWQDDGQMLAFMLGGGLCGVVAASVFWRVRRPDRLAATP